MAGAALHYEAPINCPTADEFVELVRERNPVVASFLTNHDSRRTVSVVLRSTADAYSGSLGLFDADRLELERTVGGATCAGVANALAFIAAMVAESISERDDATTKSSEPELSPSPRSTPPPTEATPIPWSFALGVGAEVASTISPAPSWGALVFLNAERQKAGFGSFSFRLGIEQTLAARATNAVGAATFRWTFGRFEVSPVQLNLAKSLQLRPLLRADGGLLVASGDLIGQNRTSSRGWAALGTLVRFEWALGPTLTLESSAGVSVPLTRDTFFFQPDATLYQPSWLIGEVDVGARLRF